MNTLPGGYTIYIHKRNIPCQGFELEISKVYAVCLSKLEFTNMLAEGVWEEDDNTPVVMIGNRLEVKSGRTPFQIEFEETVKNAEKQIQNDEHSVRLIQRINDEQIDLQKIKQEQKILNKLIRLGIVTVFLDNTIVLSPIGKQVLNNLQKSAGQLQ